MAIKILMGGSPCTYWSIAKSGREKTARGKGWELFENYLIAKERFNPDFFLYENNWSASSEIKAQIEKTLGHKLMRINSSLVSAQRRDRFYVFNWQVDKPQDRGIILADVLESGEDLTSRDKAFCLTARYSGACPWNTIERKQRTMVAECVRVGTFPNSEGEIKDSISSRIYSTNGKSVTLRANGGGLGAKTGLYAVPGKNENTYTVKDGFIVIKGKPYPIKLRDGEYAIRKLTPLECERLQTLPDGYTAGVSDTQRYKGLGNGWTAEIIIHLLGGALSNISKDEKIIVLSMYDGIGTGRYCLDKMGFVNVEYHAFEIDKWAMRIANNNYPDIIQHGDAFQIRRW